MELGRIVAVVLALTSVTPAAHPLDGDLVSRAAPGVIVLSGGPLRTPIVLSNWIENQKLMMAAATTVSIPDSALAHRQKVDVEMFWGAEWSHYASTPDSLALLRRVREAQRGAYYPAAHRKPAIWVFGPAGPMPASERLLSSEGIAILRAHRVPVSVK